MSEQEINLLLPQLIGEYNAENLSALDLQDSSFEDVGVDQSIIQSQLEALAGISEIAEGGFTESDKAANRAVQREVAQNNQARHDSLLNEFAQRGTLGSGTELAARLQANQAATDQQSQASDRLLQEAQSRALQALSQQGNLSANIRSQDFGEQSQVAQARDAINQFNTQNRQSVNNQNISNRNAGQQYNLDRAQQNANNVANVANQQEIHNQGLHQTQFQNQHAVAADRAKLAAQRGQAQQQGKQDQAAGVGSAIQGIGSALTCLLYTSPSPRDGLLSRMPSSA